jgi:hypothetical protein
VKIKFSGVDLSGGEVLVVFESPDEERGHLMFDDTTLTNAVNLRIEKAYEDVQSDEYELKVRGMIEEGKRDNPEWYEAFGILLDMLSEDRKSDATLSYGTIEWLMTMAKTTVGDYGFRNVLKEFGMDPDSNPDDPGEPDHD